MKILQPGWAKSPKIWTTAKFYYTQPKIFKTRTGPNALFSVSFQTPLASAQLESFKGGKKIKENRAFSLF